LEVSSSRTPPFSESKSFPGIYQNLARISEFVRQFAKEAGFDSLGIYSVEMAVDEACSNIIEHAYGGEGKGEIECTCSVALNSLTIILRDKGKKFNPSEIPQPNLSANLDERQAHGLGLFFINQWMDEVEFHSNGNENVLTMVKRKSL
jgi:serine/threonine-protein kinase RsbW